jgi:Ca2+-binding EF-hand superfamily protein
MDDKLMFGFRLLDDNANGYIAREDVYAFVDSVFTLLSSLALSRPPEVNAFIREVRSPIQHTMVN